MTVLAERVPAGGVAEGSSVVGSVVGAFGFAVDGSAVVREIGSIVVVVSS